MLLKAAWVYTTMAAMARTVAKGKSILTKRERILTWMNRNSSKRTR